MRKNIITSSSENIILFFGNITSHFAGKTKIIALVSIIIMLGFVNIINTSALSYSSDVNISFTFNPTISISLSSTNLDISNLMPGNTLDSNSINVSVSSNNANGYTMLATVGNIEYDNTNLNHSNNANTFSSISTNANLASLTTDNTWGYSYSIDSGSSWSNYNGLSLYSSNGTTLINKLGPAESGIDFKIAAKASSAQASGIYSNVINFIAITRPNPVSLEDAYNSYYLSTGKTKHNGYYVMQDMNSVICNNVELLDSELQVIDIRDDKVYWIAKLRDGNCWMTQNLDLDLSHDRSLTSNDTDLNDTVGVVYQDGYTMNNGVIYWTPVMSANIINFTTNSGYVGWGNSKTSPQSASKTNYIGSGHASLGNHYNWTAAIASNNSSSLDGNTLDNTLENPQNSICLKGWRLPTVSSQSEALIGSTNEFARLNYLYNNNRTDTVIGIMSSPLWFLMAGLINGNTGWFSGVDSVADYWSSTAASKDTAYLLSFISTSIGPTYEYNRGSGFSVRCLAR